MKAIWFILFLPALLCAGMLHPAYYSGEMKVETDGFLAACHQLKMHHPIENKRGKSPDCGFGKPESHDLELAE